MIVRVLAVGLTLAVAVAVTVTVTAMHMWDSHPAPQLPAPTATGIVTDNLAAFDQGAAAVPMWQ